MGNSRRRVTLSNEDAIENFENAADAVCEELDVELSTGRGRAKEGEISTATVVEELATAYTGHDVRENGDE